MPNSFNFVRKPLLQWTRYSRKKQFLGFFTTTFAFLGGFAAWYNQRVLSKDHTALADDRVDNIDFPEKGFKPIIKNLVFRGGGPKGIVYVGALLELEKKLKGFQGIERVAGTSAGAITATLLAVGYTPSEIQVLLRKTPLSHFIKDGTELDQLTTELATTLTHRSHLMKVFSSFGVLASHPILTYRLGKRLFEKRGICSGDQFREWMDDAIASKVAHVETGDINKKGQFKNLTFGELANYIKKQNISTRAYRHLHIVGAMIKRDGEVERPIFNTEDEEYKNYIISDSVRISMSIPFIFDPHVNYIKKDNQRLELESDKLGIDGGIFGILTNYPITIFDENRYLSEPFAKQPPHFRSNDFINFETLGLTMYDKRISTTIFSWFRNIGRIRQQGTWQNDDDKVARDVKIDIRGVSLLDFNLPDQKIDELIESGRTHTISYFSTEFKRFKKYQQTKIKERQKENNQLIKKHAELSNLWDNHPVSHYQVPEQYQKLKFFIEDFDQSNKHSFTQLGIVGISGSGKSELARYSAHQYLLAHFWYCWKQQNLKRNENMPVIWFVESETEETCFESIKDLAKKLGISVDEEGLKGYGKTTKEKTNRLYAFIRQKLENYSHSLLVFDNVVEYRSIIDYLKRDQSRTVLITTQDDSIKNNKSDYNTVIDLNKGLSAVASKSLIQTLYPAAKSDSLDTLIEKMGGLPLGLTVASCYMKENNLTAVEYLKRWDTQYAALEKEQENLVQGRGALERKRLTQSAVIRIPIEKIYQDKIAYTLLSLCGYLKEDNIPQSLLMNYIIQQEEPINEAEICLKAALKQLQAYSLVHIDSKNNTLSIHRLVQAETRYHHQALSSVYMGAVLQLLNDQLKNPENDRSLLIQHGLHFVKLRNVPLENKLPLSHLLHHLGKYHFDNGDYIEAKENWEQALGIEEQRYGSRSVEIVDSLNALGNIYQALGDPKRSKDLLEQALLICKRNYTKEHAHTATTLTSLGNAYGDLGDYAKRKELLIQALAINETLYGKEHPKTAITLTNLGNTYGFLGDYAQAKELLTQALVIKEKYYGKEHPHTATTLVGLGNAYGDLGDYKQAKELLTRALAIDEKHYGKDHPQTAVTLTNLGRTYGSLGDYKQAKELLTQALAIDEKYYGNGHIKTAATLTNLGNAYGALGDYRKKKELLIQALVIKEKYYGKDHPQTAITLTNLGIVYGYLGDYLQAKGLLTQALAINEKHYGEKHPKTAITLANLGNVYYSLEDYTQAKELLTRALAIDEKYYGKEHPHIGAILTNLGNTYGSLGDYQRKKEILTRALAIKEKHFGEEHPETAITLTNLGVTYVHLKDLKNAFICQKRAYDIFLKSYGSEHQYTKESFQELQKLTIPYQELLVFSNTSKTDSNETKPPISTEQKSAPKKAGGGVV